MHGQTDAIRPLCDIAYFFPHSLGLYRPSTLVICDAEIPMSQPTKILATLLLGAVSGLGFYSVSSPVTRLSALQPNSFFRPCRV